MKAWQQQPQQQKRCPAKQSNLSTSKQSIFHQTALSVNSLQIEIRFNRFIIKFFVCLVCIGEGSDWFHFESLTNMKCSQLTSTTTKQQQQKLKQNIFVQIVCWVWYSLQMNQQIQQKKSKQKTTLWKHIMI